MKGFLQFSTFLTLIYCPLSSAYHVMFTQHIGSKSQLLLTGPVMEELLDRGHQVTAMIYSSTKIKHENFTELLIPNIMENMFQWYGKMALEEGEQNPLSPKLWWMIYNAYKVIIKDWALSMFHLEGFQTLLDSKSKIDVVVTTWALGATVAELFDAPVIVFQPAGPIDIQLKGTGNVINRSVQPHLLSPFIEPLTFLQRLQNHLQIIMFNTFSEWLETSSQSYVSDYLGYQLPSHREIFRERTSISLSCSHPLTHGAWPYLPNLIEVGGVQLKEGKTLPLDLRNFMDSHTEGVVLISFGSALRPEQMKAERREMLLTTLRELGVAVIWKWDQDLEDLPSNVMVSKWLPQQDLLAHPNLKVFVTHGGLGSVVEAIYHKSVLVGIPLMSDQRPNLIRAKQHGFASILEWDSLTKDKFTEAIKDAMENKTMREAVERVNQIYTDREEKPLDRAVWWVEYVCRHRGAKWLKFDFEDIPWYQLHYVDLVLFLVVVVSTSLATMFFCCRALISFSCQKKRKVD